MKTNYFLCLFLLLVSISTQAQNFEKEILQVKKAIDSIVFSEKQLLKEEILKIEKQFENKEISLEKSQQLKLEVAQKSSAIIEEKVSLQKKKLDTLINERVLEQVEVKEQPKIEKKKENKKKSKKVKDCDDDCCEDWISFNFSNREPKMRDLQRVRGGLTFAIAAHNVYEEGKWGNNAFRFWGSKSIEIGYSRNVRLLKNNNLLHLNYGLSFMINKLKMDGNTHFVDKNGITSIENFGSSVDLSKFKANYLTLPVNLELDFSEPYEKYNRKYYPVKKSFRMGVGAYLGVLTGNRQVIEFDNQRNVDRRDFNLNKWIYGVSAHMGYGLSVFYVKCSLTPLFKNNPINQYPFSVGIRFGG